MASQSKLDALYMCKRQIEAACRDLTQAINNERRRLESAGTFSATAIAAQVTRITTETTAITSLCSELGG